MCNKTECCNGRDVTNREDVKNNEIFKQVLDIRKFEIELYWKRASYFWVFNSLAFSAYGAVYVKMADHSNGIAMPQDFEMLRDLLVCLSCVGLVVSLAWVLVNKGSKFWQENWETHLDLIEKDIVGDLYKTVYETHASCCLKDLLTGSGKFSVSKVNQLISIYAVFLWCIMANSATGFVTTSISLNLRLVSLVVTAFCCLLLVVFGRTGTGEKTVHKIVRSTKELVEKE
ncbi:MAG: hypothetical protein KKF77_02040 [Proteobacteria bacterium]|nr:hypothetical protein [Pseudomonadota bacterium]